MDIIVLEHIKKNYGSIKALDDISLSVAKGEIFGIIGPDGAGKTTLFRIMNSLMLADQGKAHTLGFDTRTQYKEIRSRIGYMPGRFSLYTDLSVQENIEVFASIFKVDWRENIRLVEPIYKQLEPFKNRRAGALSGGMKQKLALCCALIHKPDILFLDEPTTGVDPTSRKEFWDILSELESEGITIVASTPYMDEANRCDRIALIQKGKILSIDSPEGIKRNYSSALWGIAGEPMFPLLKTLEKSEFCESVYPFGDQHHFEVKQDAQISMTSLKKSLEDKGFKDLEVVKLEPSIEDCFMNLSKTNGD